MLTIYVLELEDGCFYVGKTRNSKGRIQAHFQGTASSWTSLHKPLRVLSEEQTISEMEDATVLRLMALHGIDKVRGGTFSRVELDETERMFLTKMLRMNSDCCVLCGATNHFAAQCPRKNITQPLLTPPPSPPPACSRCGRTTHFVASCAFRTDVRGIRLCAANES
jgi:hypothetical protein